MSAIRARMRKLIAERAATAAALVARPRLDSTAKAARIMSMMARADPLADMTASNRRCCRVAELLYRAQDRAALSAT